MWAGKESGRGIWLNKEPWNTDAVFHMVYAKRQRLKIMINFEDTIIRYSVIP